MGGLFDSVIMGAALVGEHTVSDWQQWACRPDGRGRGCHIEAFGRGDLYFTITTRTNTFQKPMLQFLFFRIAIQVPGVKRAGTTTSDGSSLSCGYFYAASTASSKCRSGKVFFSFARSKAYSISVVESVPWW